MEAGVRGVGHPKLGEGREKERETVSWKGRKEKIMEEKKGESKALSEEKLREIRSFFCHFNFYLLLS